MFGNHLNLLTMRQNLVKDVHKSPVLDLVGWFTITPPSGPDGSHLPIHRQILQNFNESAVLLAFHPSLLVSTSATGAKLPLTIYESFFDGETSGDGDKLMHIDGEEQFLSIRFRELPCTIETGEAEMISVNFVAGSGGSAMAIENPPGAAATDTDSQWQPGKKNRMGRQATGTEPKAADTASLLSPEEEDCKWKIAVPKLEVKNLTDVFSNRQSHNAPQCHKDTGISNTPN
jgi:COP9 signalosome complex subunit 6